MFESRANSVEVQPESTPPYKRKANILRSHIRRKQLDEYFSSIREQMMSSLVQDYQVLKLINLPQTLRELAEFTLQAPLRWQSIEKITNDIFIYSHSSQSDHLYYLLDFRVLSKLVDMAHSPLDFQQTPRSYVRILSILANYSLYSEETIGRLGQIALRLVTEITSGRDFYERKASYLFFTYSQTKQVLFLALQVLANESKGQFLRRACLDPTPKISLLVLLLEQCTKINQFCRLNTIGSTSVSDILISIVCIFQKILTFTDVSPTDLIRIHSVDFQIVNIMLLLLGTLEEKQKQGNSAYRILFALEQFLMVHLRQSPNIVLSHDFSVLLKLFEHYSEQSVELSWKISNYNSQLEIKGTSLANLGTRAKQVQKRIKTLLNIFNIFFSINIPLHHSLEYEEIFENWLAESLMPALRGIFKISHQLLDQIRYSALLMLKNVCLQEFLCDLILEQFQILNKIFYYIHSDIAVVRMRKAALQVLNSIICSTLYENGELKSLVLDLLSSNKIIDIFLSNLCEYADNELNINLLNSLDTYFQTDAQPNTENVLWIQFCAAGGKEKLEKSLLALENTETIQLIRLLLDKYGED